MLTSAPLVSGAIQSKNLLPEDKVSRSHMDCAGTHQVCASAGHAQHPTWRIRAIRWNRSAGIRRRDRRRRTASKLHRPVGRRVARAAAGVLVVLMVSAALVACGPSGGGCRRASSSLVIDGSNGVVSSGIGTLTGPVSAHASPGKDKRRFNCTKQESPVWQQLKPYRGSIKTNGKKGKKARFYEWDYTHNDIEVYGPAPRYEHLGSADPRNGDSYKPPVKDRNLRDELK